MTTPLPRPDDLQLARAALSLGLLARDEVNAVLQGGPSGTLVDRMLSGGRWTAEDLARLNEILHPLQEEGDDGTWRGAAEVLRAGQDPERLMDLALTLLVRETGAERGFLMLLDAERRPSFVTSRNVDADVVNAPEHKVSRSIVQAVAQGGEAVLLADARSDPRFASAESIQYLELTSVMAVPVRDQGRVLGVVYLENRFARSRFGSRALERARGFVELVAGPLATALALRDFRARATELERLYRQLLSRLGEARHGLVGNSPALDALHEQIDRLAGSEVSVLIVGESGTGKVIVARAIHQSGPRAPAPFVGLNCAATVASLLESELFGHRRGAFTGATEDRKGLFEQADGGTLFLDEVGDMPAAMQAKLLRVLQEGEVTPLGGEASRKVNVRLLAATHKNLPSAIDRGEFRQDLYFRIAGVTVTVPPLRERREDIPLLAAHLLKAAGADAQALTGGALKRLLEHHWPGNVRELQSTLERARILAGDRARIQRTDVIIDSAPAPTSDRPRGPWKDQLNGFEALVVRTALQDARGNVRAAARQLDLTPRALYDMMDRQGIARRRHRR